MITHVDNMHPKLFAKKKVQLVLEKVRMVDVDLSQLQRKKRNGPFSFAITNVLRSTKSYKKNDQ
jgi:hypothetical protein